MSELPPLKLVIVIPAWNEEQEIGQVIAQIHSSLPATTSYMVVVIDDGSTDRTVITAHQAGAEVVSLAGHCGLGVAFQRGVDEALTRGADVMVTIDADGQFDASDIPKLTDPIIKGQADVVTASRFKDPALTPKMPGAKIWGNRQIAKLITRVGRQTIADASCGFRTYSRSALMNLNLFSRYTYTHESLLSLMFKGFRIMEIPVVVHGSRQNGDSRIAHNLWTYGFHMTHTVFRTVLDYWPLRVFGGFGIGLFLLGLLLELWLLIHLLITGALTPYKFIGFIGLGLNVVGSLFIVIGLIADMLNRIRITQERTLTIAKRHRYDQSSP